MEELLQCHRDCAGFQLVRGLRRPGTCKYTLTTESSVFRGSETYGQG